MKQFSLDSAAALGGLATASSRVTNHSRAALKERISYVYGAMDGQRAVDVPELAARIPQLLGKQIELADAVIALEYYFVIVCHVIALSAWQDSPSDYLRRIGSSEHEAFRKFLVDLGEGKPFDAHGLGGFRYCIDLSWIADHATDEEISAIAESLSRLARLWHDKEFKIPGDDPFQIIHHSLFPKNLLHISGQFYTPEWLADLLLADSAWAADQSLIDPFCGSGVFLVRALRKSINQGVAPEAALKNILGLDLNPMACAAARCNLALALAGSKRRDGSIFNINVCATDSLSPAVVAGLERFSPTVSAAYPQFSNLELNAYGLDLGNWSDQISGTKSKHSEVPSFRGRAELESKIPHRIRPSDVVLTNPPWVGWEYIARPYRDYLMPAWRTYDLFKSKGLEAAFLKEDLSTLGLLTAWDKYLKEGGKSAVVLRPATMFSDVAAKGVRRLSIGDSGAPLRLERIRLFHNVKVFGDAATDTATWQVHKGQSTRFPVPVVEWSKTRARWNPNSSTPLEELVASCAEINKVAMPTVPADPSSRWLVDHERHMASASSLQGGNSYSPRMGVFTGGANAVFYLNVMANDGVTSHCRNIIERAKRPAPQVEMRLENELIYSVARGRDISRWRVTPEVHLLCCHSAQTKLTPIPETTLESQFPLAYKYLLSMRSILQDRQGFSGWEKDVLLKYFYTLQRIGDYTFAPFKVCWKYIATEFTVCVIGSDESGKPILPNDKVMFIPFASEESAYFLCGLLSSNAVSQYVNASTSKRQISVSAIKSIALPIFDGTDGRHREISDLCKAGHERLQLSERADIQDLRNQIDILASDMF